MVYSVGDMDKVTHFLCDYGGLSITGEYQTDSSVIGFWNLPSEASAEEKLIQFDDHPTGLIRLVKYQDVAQEYIRSSQKPWDIGGIMDINLRVPEVAQTFEDLRDLGFHGLSDPLLQEMGPFKLYDILMQGYDDIIIAFTHRVKPPLDLKEGFKIPSHIYNSSLTVRDLMASQDFYKNQLGFTLMNEYTVQKDAPIENMFGIPMNIITDVQCKVNMFSPDGSRDVMFQACEFEGVEGKDFSKKAIPPNRGLLLYRCEVDNLVDYYNWVKANGVVIHKPLQELTIAPYGMVTCFAILSPDGVWWEFLERNT